MGIALSTHWLFSGQASDVVVVAGGVHVHALQRFSCFFIWSAHGAVPYSCSWWPLTALLLDWMRTS